MNMGSMIDLTGKRFGKLLAIHPNGKQWTNVVWHCQCDCGNTIDLSGDYLRSGTRSDCGCVNPRKHRIKPGDRFGKLTVIEHIGFTPSKKRIWNCQCDCGNTIEVSTVALNGGRKTSCGCDEEKEKRKAIRVQIGQRYGRLTVVRELYNTPEGKPIWECECDCGNKTTATTWYLLHSVNQNCGQCNEDTISGQLCWSCKHATNKYGKCSWSARLEPVKGWNATEVCGECGKSYKINKCPLFERG